MGKTFVALAVACAVAHHSRRGPVVVMAPANLIGKWEQDLRTFCELYLNERLPVSVDESTDAELKGPGILRYGIARDSVDFMRLLDSPSRLRAQLVFMAHGAMGRRQHDRWIRLALIAAALKRHGRGGAAKLNQVKKVIFQSMGEILHAVGMENASDLGEFLWQKLLDTPFERWQSTYNASVSAGSRRLQSPPVPKTVAKAIPKTDLSALARALKAVPLRTSSDVEQRKLRIHTARRALVEAERLLWPKVLNKAQWRSPLLVMDEAHHLKNAGTKLARQLQSPESEDDLKAGDGAMARTFERMLFLTATPFQMGHHELVNVLKRFEDVKWDAQRLGDRQVFRNQMNELHARLDASQRATIALQRAWSRLRVEDAGSDIDAWWEGLHHIPIDQLNVRQRAVVEAFDVAKTKRDDSQAALQPWLVRHNKGDLWAGTTVDRRSRRSGAAVASQNGDGGLPIPRDLLLPFFLAARSAVRPDRDLLGSALSSSYQAFRYTRKEKRARLDDQEMPDETENDLDHLAQSKWYLSAFDRALEGSRGADHPKIRATVNWVADRWEQGEKVLVFGFYRYTCRALRIHISDEIQKRVSRTALRTLEQAGRSHTEAGLGRLVDRIQNRFFDNSRAPGRRALDAALDTILYARREELAKTKLSARQHESIRDVMRRFLRVNTTLVRCFPLPEVRTLSPAEVVERALGHVDASGISWRQKFDGFLDFITRCSDEERTQYLEAARTMHTGAARVEVDDESAETRSARTLANVQMATGVTKRETRTRLLQAFNTPFLPDVLVCSEVMGEGVDLQRSCRHVIHHDLAWNPSTIEQRTGRIDRLGYKSEGRHPIVVGLPYLAGAADERQFRVMSDREQWFRVVMGQEKVAQLITPDSSVAVPLPRQVADELGFSLGVAIR